MWTPSPQGPKEELCAGSENGLRATGAEIQGSWIPRVGSKSRGPEYQECDLECGKWAPDGYGRRASTGPSKAHLKRQGSQLPGYLGGRVGKTAGITWGRVEKKIVHVKPTVWIEDGNDMFRFTGYKAHSGGNAKDGLEGELEKINWSTFAQRGPLETQLDISSKHP